MQQVVLNALIAVGLAWLLAIFIGRLREARVRIVFRTAANVEQPDLDLSTAVAQEFALVRHGGRPGLAVVEAIDREVDLPAALLPSGSTATDPVSIIGRLLLRTYVLDIRYEDDDPGDLTAVVRLHSPLGRLISNEVIKESSFLVLRREPGKLPFAPADDLRPRRRRLGIAIAAWATYQLLQQGGRERFALLTPDWRSYALFRFGVEWSSLGSKEHSRRAYREALDTDPFNRGALFNLGVVEATRGCHAAALSMFESARSETERVSHGIAGARSTDPLWYRAVYNIAAVRHHARAELSGGPECHLPADPTAYGEARARLEWMIVSAGSTLVAIERRQGSRIASRYAWLGGFLRMTQAASIVLLAMMLETDG